MTRYARPCTCLRDLVYQMTSAMSYRWQTFHFFGLPPRPHLVKKSHQLLTGTTKLERLPGPYCDAYQSFEETLKLIGIALLIAHSLVLKWVLRIPPPPVWSWSWVVMKQSSPGHLNSLFYHFLFLTCQKRTFSLAMIILTVHTDKQWWLY